MRCFEAEDDEADVSPCFSCLPASILSIKADECWALLKGKTVVVEGLGEEKEKSKEDFHANGLALASVNAMPSPLSPSITPLPPTPCF